MRAARVDRRRRRDVALAFETILTDVRPARALTARAPVERAQVLDAQPEIDQLVAHLRDRRRRVAPAALLLAEELLCDLDGPLFVPAPAGALRMRVRLVRIAL